MEFPCNPPASFTLDETVQRALGRHLHFNPPGSSTLDETEDLACPQTQIISSIQQQIPPDQIAARIGEMIQAKQPSESGDLEPDWRTVEAGIRLYLDYATKFPTAGGIESPPRPLPEPTTAHTEAAAARRETKRNYSPHQPEIIPPRPTVRVLPTKNTDRAALEPLENMRKLLILETPLAVLQSTPGSPSRISGPPIANTATDLHFEMETSPLPPPGEKSTGRNLPLVALVACLVIGGIFAGASQFHTRPQSSSIPMIQEKPPMAEAAPPQKTEPATGLAALKPRFETSMW